MKKRLMKLLLSLCPTEAAVKSEPMESAWRHSCRWQSEAHDDISLSYESADYEAVKEALKKVPEDTSIYTEESVKALEQAIQNIDWDLDVRGMHADCP